MTHSDQMLAVHVGEIAALRVEAEGMVATNAQRAACGNSMAYTEEAFDRIASMIRDRVSLIAMLEVDR